MKTLSFVLYQIPKNHEMRFSKIPGSGFQSNPGIPGYPGIPLGPALAIERFRFCKECDQPTNKLADPKTRLCPKYVRTATARQQGPSSLH